MARFLALSIASLAAACGGSSSSTDAPASAIDAPPFATDGPLADAPFQASTIFEDDFATFPSAKWQSANTAQQHGTGSSSTDGDPAPGLDVGGAPDAPDGTALRAVATWPSAPGFTIEARAKIPPTSAPVGSKATLEVTAYDTARTGFVRFTFSVWNNSAMNTPFPGPAGVRGALTGSDTAVANEFQTPLSAPDTGFHTIKLSQGADGMITYGWDGIGQGIGTGFPAGSTIHLEIVGSRSDLGGSAAPGGPIVIDQVTIKSP
ncbi:MAG: hypothetical protein K8W52_14520 [Deltaproteobacteria bacterium]|nr:hypothetical protein [Deltaproteobacteria bacterium]